MPPFCLLIRPLLSLPPRVPEVSLIVRTDHLLAKVPADLL